MSSQGTALRAETELVQAMKRERSRHGALADGAGHPLGGAVADVARREEAGPARLERERVSIERPALGACSAVEQVGAGEDEARPVGDHSLAGTPRRVRAATDAEEEGGRPDGL